MKLAYFTSRYPAISHTFIMREIMALRERGITVETISQRSPGADDLLTPADRREYENTRYILPPSWGRMLAAHGRTLFTHPLRYFATLGFALTTRPGGFRDLLWHLFYFLEAVQLWDELRSRGVGHVHVHFIGPCATVAMIASRLGTLTYSITVHGPIVFYDVSKNLIAPKIERAAFAICISDFARAQVAAHVATKHWSKLHIAHCGVDTTRFRPDASRAAGSTPAGLGSTESAASDIPNRRREVLCVARLAPVKGVGVLIEAIARLADEIPALHCTLVGDGPERAQLERLAADLGVKDLITFAGATGQDDILAYYQQADVFALPSFAEGVPVVLMEAMATGVPAIATAVGGIGELIEHGVSGLIVPPGNVALLSGALRRVLTDDGLHARLAEGGRRKVVAEFEISDIGRQIAALFAAKLGGTPAGETAAPAPAPQREVHAPGA